MTNKTLERASDLFERIENVRGLLLRLSGREVITIKAAGKRKLKIVLPGVFFAKEYVITDTDTINDIRTTVARRLDRLKSEFADLGGSES